MVDHTRGQIDVGQDASAHFQNQQQAMPLYPAYSFVGDSTYVSDSGRPHRYYQRKPAPAPVPATPLLSLESYTDVEIPWSRYFHMGAQQRTQPTAMLSGSANVPSATQPTHVPDEILTNELVEGIKAECCFIGELVEILLTPVPAVPSSNAMSVDEADVPPSSDGPSEPSPPPSPVHLDHRNTARDLTAGSRQTYWESIAAIYQKKLDHPRSVSQGELT